MNKRYLALSFLLILLIPLAVGNAALAQGPVRIIFLHHSCGHNLIEQGGVREGLTRLGYEFYDHGYNGEGLRLADGSYSGRNFAVPGDNTDPDGIATIFAQPLHDPPDNTFSHLMQYDVIAFKSCFPTSNIASDDQLEQYKSYYRSVRDRMDQHPEKIFIVVTQPPQVPGASDAEEARRARALANWLKSDQFLSGHPNVFTFDFFDYLAGSDNFLRAEYRFDDYDGHPNQRANREIGPEFVAFFDRAIQSYDLDAVRPTTAPPTPTPPEPTLAPASEEPEATEAPPTAGAFRASDLIGDFESDAGRWESSVEEGSSVECAPDNSKAYAGERALRITYNLASDGMGCGRSFETPQDWSDGTGISMWFYAEEMPPRLKLMLFSGDPNDATPFEVEVPFSEESMGGWTRIGFSWASFERAAWAAGGLSEVDPTRMIGYGFSLDAGEGVLWVDDVHSSVGGAPPPAISPEAPDESPTPEPTAEPGAAEEPQPQKGICPGAALALPLSTLGLLMTARRRNN